MARAVSLHIGLNRVDASAYNGWDGALAGCINDARDMEAIADSLGYASTLLTDAQATSDGVIEAIGRTARQLVDGDIFVLTYSGHGGQVPDANGDEPDGMDETWVLYDRMLVDDEIYGLLSHFPAGVRIFVLSDSCHSGTVLKVMAYKEYYGTATKRAANPEPPRFKHIDRQLALALYSRDERTYRAVQWSQARGNQTEIAASAILISGCQDNQLSADGNGNGLFTGTLKQVWDQGAFSGTYGQFAREIASRMPPDQSPNLYCVGTRNAAFEAQRPFTIGGSEDGSPAVVPDTSVADQPTLWRGATGPAVRRLQTLLAGLGYGGVAPDGIFGPRTEVAVREFQAARGLVVDGVVGRQTWSALQS